VPLVSASISGTVLNPFLVFSGSIMTTYIYEHQWVYYIAPLIGVILGGIFSKADLIQSLFISNLENVVSIQDDMTKSKLNETKVSGVKN
jgi:hypothetical protein